MERKKGNAARKAKRVAVPTREVPEPVALALLSMFAMVDDVMTEDDAFDDLKRKMGFGRIYEEWKRCRVVLDPGFKPELRERPARWLPKTVREAKADTSRPATGSRRSSSGTKSISGKKSAEKNAKPSRSTSAKRRAT